MLLLELLYSAPTGEAASLAQLDFSHTPPALPQLWPPANSKKKRRTGYVPGCRSPSADTTLLTGVLDVK